MEVKYVKLGEHCSKIGSGATPKGGSSVYVDSGVSLIRSQNVYNLQFSYSGLAHICDSAANKLKGVTVYKDDVLLNITGDSVARTCIVPENVLPARVNQHVAIIRPKKDIDSRYLNYYLASPSMQGYLLSIASTGASRNAITKAMIEKLIIPIPDFSTQRRIASILSAYDNLIEANSRRIKILEQMAENLYKEWFVRFRFPGHEKEEKENGLPKGWNIAPLSSEYNTTSGGTPSRTNLNYYSGSIPWIKTGELQGTFILDTEEHITEEAVRKSSAKLIPAYSLLIAMYAGANVGNLGINSIVATCNQACCVITTKGRYPLYYLLFFLQTQKRFLQSISFGAAQQNISQDIVKKLKVLFPPSTLCDTFNKLVSPYLQQCELLLKENQFLTRQRDLLLPRLMSGQLTPLTNQ